MADDHSADASKVEKLLKYHEKVSRYHYDNPHKILKSLQKQQKILESMQLEKPDLSHWFPRYLAERVVIKGTRASEWTYNRMFEEVGQRHRPGVHDESSEVDEKMCILLHFILIMNRKLQELIRRSILYIHPRSTGQENAETPYKILRFDDYTEATNFEMLSEHAMRAQDGSLLSKIQDAWKVIEGKVCHFDDGERSADFVEFAEYIKTTTESIRDRFLQEAKKTGKWGKELYAEPGIMALKQEFIDTLWKPFLTRDFKSLCGEPRSPLDGHYAWYWGSVYRQSARGNSSSDREWAFFCHNFGFSATLTGAWNDYILDYNLAAEDGVKRTLEQYYRLHWDDDDFAGQSAVAPVPHYVHLVHPSHAGPAVPDYVHFLYPSHAPAHLLPSAALFPRRKPSQKTLQRNHTDAEKYARAIAVSVEEIELFRGILCDIYALLEMGPGPTEPWAETTDADQLHFAVYEIFRSLVIRHKSRLYTKHAGVGQRAAYAIMGAAEPLDAQWYRGSTRVKQPIPGNKLLLGARGFWRGGLAPPDGEATESELEELVRYYRAVEDYANHDLPGYVESMFKTYLPECLKLLREDRAYPSKMAQLSTLGVLLREFAVFTTQHFAPRPGSLAPRWSDWWAFTKHFQDERRGEFANFVLHGFRMKYRHTVATQTDALLDVILQWHVSLRGLDSDYLRTWGGMEVLAQLEVSINALRNSGQWADTDDQCARVLQLTFDFIERKRRKDTKKEYALSRDPQAIPFYGNELVKGILQVLPDVDSEVLRAMSAALFVIKEPMPPPSFKY